jgi:hypothetical protein
MSAERTHESPAVTQSGKGHVHWPLLYVIAKCAQGLHVQTELLVESPSGKVLLVRHFLHVICGSWLPLRSLSTAISVSSPQTHWLVWGLKTAGGWHGRQRVEFEEGEVLYIGFN